MNKKKYKADVVLVIVLLIICIAAFAATQLLLKKEGSYAIVRVDGKLIYELRLDEDAEVIAAGYNGGSNRIVIKSGQVYVAEADCPDALCVKTGNISKTGETIVCLPHRVVVEITGEAENVDSVVQ